MQYTLRCRMTFTYRGASRAINGEPFDSMTLKELQAQAAPDHLPEDPAVFRAAVALIRFVPRGRGAIPRLLGRMMFGEDDLFMTGTPRGFNIVGTRSSIDMLAFLKLTGGWDEPILEACSSLIGQGGVFYDIGANAGYYSLAIAARKPRPSRIIAFEPLPDLATAIATSAHLNGFADFEVYRAALSSVAGTTEFYLPAHSIHASLVARADSGVKKLRVATFTMDDLVGSGALPPPDVLKMDVEGAEMLVLDGATETLSTHLPAICYECDDNAGRFGHTPGKMIRRLESLGYRQFEHLRGEAGWVVLREDQYDEVPEGDFIARPAAAHQSSSPATTFRSLPSAEPG